MKIYTYYQDINFSVQQELIDLWKISWSRQGYEPIVLNLEDAKKHPYFQTLNSEMRRIFKEITNKEINNYGMSCWFRWLAYATQVEEKCYVSDYDAINVNFQLKDPSSKLHFMDQCVPFLASGKPSQFENLCRAFVEVSNERVEILKEQANHYHDQEFLKYNFTPKYNNSYKQLINKYDILMTRDRYKLGGYIDPVENKILAGAYIGYISKKKYKVVHVSHENVGILQQKYSKYKNQNAAELRIKVIKDILNEKT